MEALALTVSCSSRFFQPLYESDSPTGHHKGRIDSEGWTPGQAQLKTQWTQWNSWGWGVDMEFDLADLKHGWRFHIIESLSYQNIVNELVSFGVSASANYKQATVLTRAHVSIKTLVALPLSFFCFYAYIYIAFAIFRFSVFASMNSTPGAVASSNLFATPVQKI